MSARGRQFICGAIDAAIPFAVLFLFYAFSEGLGPHRVLSEKNSIVMLFAFPLALLMAWRGSVDAKRLMTGDAAWKPRIIEGFCWGFFFLPIQLVWAIVQFAWAAGPSWPMRGDPWMEWVRYSCSMLAVSILLGVIGVVVGMAVSGVNRGILRLFKEGAS